MEDRIVEADGQQFKIRIGYGAYQRIDYLRLLVDATRPQKIEDYEDEKPVEETEDVPEMTEEEKDFAYEAALAALKAEGIFDSADEAALKPNTDLTGVQGLLDMIDVETSVSEKVREAKFKIIKLAVRRQDGAQIDDEFLENGLSPIGGETLFTQVMETFEVLKAGVEDVELKKK
jgi:hypothetical protein